MAKIKVTKLEAAQRQIDAAIRLLFKNEDPVAIHTVAAAGLQILKDLAKKDTTQVWQMMDQCFRPGMRKKWRNEVENKAVNFLKHADKDPDEALENVDEIINDLTLFSACILYDDLGHQYTPEMTGFMIWYSGIFPDHIRDDLPWSAMLAEAANNWCDLPRNEQLAFGKEILDMCRQSH